MPNGADHLVALLESQGVSHVFGIPGGQVLSIMNAIRKTPAIRFVTTRHEGAAACMADAFGRLTGKPGICLATTGPGSTNLLTGIGGALRDSSPTIVLVAGNNSRDTGRDDAQALDHVSVFKPLVKDARRVVHADQLPEAVLNAFRTALSGSPGPVLLEFTRDVLEQDTAASGATDGDCATVVPFVPTPSSEAISPIVEALNSARKPVMWLGNGAKIARAGDVLLKIAESASIPIVTTYNASGVVPTSHPLVFGSLYRHGSSVARSLLSEADMVLAIGNSFNAISTNRWSLPLPDLYQVDVDPLIIGRYYPVKHGVIAGALPFAQALARHSLRMPDGRSAWVSDLKAQKEQWTKDLSMADTEAGIDPVTVMYHVRNALEQPANFIADAGNPGIWSQALALNPGDFYLKPVGFGNMGFALPGAIAASLVDDGRLPVAIVGDGSLGMTLAELETANREQAHMLLVVLDDSGYGNIRQEQVYKFGIESRETVGVSFGETDYGAVAEAFGWKSWSVRTSEDLRQCLHEAVVHARQGRAFIRVHIDGQRTVWPTAY